MSCFGDDFDASLTNSESEAIISLANSGLCIKEHILESESSTELKGFKYKKYISLFCKMHANGEELEMCYDIDSGSFLISAVALCFYYSLAEVFQMKNDQKIRCQGIEKKKKSNF